MPKSFKAYFHSFTVEGFGSFPTDMLRYDECFPLTEADSGRIHQRERRKVQLGKVGPNKNWEPTHGRWQSFTWKVTSVNGKDVTD